MFGIKFIKFQPSEYVLKYKKGKLVREGAGISFYYYEPTTSIVMVPIASSDSFFMFEELTADFQSVSIQGQLTYRILNRKSITDLLNFTLAIKRGHWRYLSDDPQKLPVKPGALATSRQRAGAQLYLWQERRGCCHRARWPGGKCFEIPGRPASHSSQSRSWEVRRRAPAFFGGGFAADSKRSAC